MYINKTEHIVLLLCLYNYCTLRLSELRIMKLLLGRLICGWFYGVSIKGVGLVAFSQRGF